MTDRQGELSRQAVRFGSFHLLPTQHLLLEAGRPVRLGSRALGILSALIERHGEVVTNQDLIARVWPATFVEEANLRVHIASLRKVLGDGPTKQRFIANVPGRGYQFVAPVTYEDPNTAEGPSQPVATEAVRGIPALLSRVIGRDDVVTSIGAELTQRRFITVAGPGGIGKTTVALALARAQSPVFRDGACFVDLTTMTDAASLPGAVAAALGIVQPLNDTMPTLMLHLRNRQMLLVLDSCEHLVEAASILAERILEDAPGVRILATSREALRAQGERVHRLATLSVPAESESLTAVEALDYSGIQLFVERATISRDEFELTDANAPLVAEICRRLDGIPLAIELAASRVDVFSIRDLLQLLGDRLKLVVKGRRTALPRHRTLAATLDWSYESLPAPESQVLRRLSMFTGPFSLEGARTIAGGRSGNSHVIELLANLVSKSLVTADVSGNDPRYSLLETTRVYAHEKLVESGEAQEIARSHAEYLRALFAVAQSEWNSRPVAEWLAAYGREVENVRRALDWAFSSAGDPSLGVALTTAAVPLWMQMSSMDECRANVERALAHIESTGDDSREALMQLHAARSLSLMYTMASSREVDAAWMTTLKIAEECGDADYQLRAIWGLFAGAINSSNCLTALSLAKRFRELAKDQNEQLIGDRIIGVALHFIGDQTGAREHTERMMARYIAPTHGAHMVRFQNDQLIAARRVLAPVLWLQGYPERAMSTVEQSVSDALAINHALTLCNLLAQSACPTAALTGDLKAMERYVNLLVDRSERHGLNIWNAYGRAFRGVLLMRRGKPREGMPLLRNATAELLRANFTQYYSPFLGAAAYGFGLLGDVTQGLSTIDDALVRSDATSERYFMPELMRIKGKLMLQQAREGCAIVAEGIYRDALQLANSQGALSWELRIAISLVSLLHQAGRKAESHDLLAPVLGRFTEGFDTEAQVIARRLLKA